MKHNKKRNTAFLYECLIKELTKAIVRKDEDTKNKIIKTIRESFSRGTVLDEDLQLYKQLLETKAAPEEATRYLIEVRKDWESLDRKEVFNAKT